MKLARRALLAGLAAAPAAAAVPGFVPEGGFDEAAFRDWVRIRAGTGAPVWWYSEGTLRAYPSGRLVALMEGFDTARVHWAEAGRLAHQYNRKIYIFRDPQTGAVLGEPIAYPYQFITYRLDGDRVETWVEQGSGARLARIGPGRTMAHRRLGAVRVFTAPLFLDLPLPQGRMQAFENYDFAADPAQPPSAWVLSWIRTGAMPPSLGEGLSVMHLVTRRYEAFEDMPEGMRAHVAERAPLWRGPPADLAEIRRLQQG
ncbi:MAG: hypothetical protein ACK4Z0_01825 [Sphingomonadaceae bacterium]